MVRFAKPLLQSAIESRNGLKSVVSGLWRIESSRSIVVAKEKINFKWNHLIVAAA